MGLIFGLFILAIPIFIIWLIIKGITWTGKVFSSKQEEVPNIYHDRSQAQDSLVCQDCGYTFRGEYGGSVCPKCGVLCLPSRIQEQFKDLRSMKEFLLKWYSEGKLMPDDFNKLDALCQDERQAIMAGVKSKAEGQKPAEETPSETQGRDYVGEMKAEQVLRNMPAGTPASMSPDTNIESSKPVLAPEPEKQPQEFPPPVISEPIITAASTDDWKNVYAKPQTAKIEPRQEKVESQPSSFLSEKNIKLMLYVGAALFILGASIFVKNNWDIIPGTVKFASLMFITIATYLTGFLLYKKNKIPKTAKTLVVLGSLLIPYNFYAVNNFALLGAPSDWRMVWLLASSICLPLYIFNHFFLKSKAFFYSSLGIYSLIIYLICSLNGMSHKYYPLVLLLSSAIVPLVIFNYLKNKINWAGSVIKEVHIFANAIAAISLFDLLTLSGMCISNDRSLSFYVGASYLVLMAFYLCDSIIISEYTFIYPGVISFYLSLFMIAFGFEPRMLTYVGIFTSAALLLEGLTIYLKKTEVDENYLVPVRRVNSGIILASSLGIFTLEIGRFIAQYFMNTGIDQLIAYQNVQITWISVVAIIYLVLLQIRASKPLYSYTLMAYAYILGFSVFQMSFDVSYHAFGFVAIGIIAMFIERWLNRKDVQQELTAPLKHFSYAFTAVTSIYLLVKYLTVSTVEGNYCLVLCRMLALMAFYGVACYLYREEVMTYVLSVLYYLSAFIFTVNIYGLQQYSLIFAIATLPLIILQLKFKNDPYSKHFSIVQALAYIISFGIGFSHGFYIFPEIVFSQGLYMSNLISLGIMLAVAVSYTSIYKQKALSYISAFLFYLIAFIGIYPVMSPAGICLVLTGLTFAAMVTSRALNRQMGDDSLSHPVDMVSHIVHALIISFFSVKGFFINGQANYQIIVATVAAQSVYYYLFAFVYNENIFNYVGVILSYLGAVIAGIYYDLSLANYCFLFISIGLIQLSFSKLFNMQSNEKFSGTYFYHSLFGLVASSVLALTSIIAKDFVNTNVYMLILPILIAYFAIATFYRRESVYEYPATLLFFFLTFTAGMNIGLSLPTLFLVMTIVSFATYGLAYYLKKLRGDLFAPVFLVTHFNILTILTTMLLNVFYLETMPPGTALFTILLQIIFYAINAYVQKNSYYIYPSGALLYLLVWMLFPQLNLPTLYLGLGLLPLSGIFTASTFLMKKGGDQTYANKFYILGQLAIVLVIAHLFMKREFFLESGFGLFSILVLLMAAIYVASSLIYKKGIYTYIGAFILLVLLYFTGVHWQFAFSDFNLEFILFAGFIYAAARLAGRYVDDGGEAIAGPLEKIALFIMVVTFVSSISRFFMYNMSGNARVMSSGELGVAMLITFVVAVVYGALCYYNKDVRYLYFSIGSFILLYIITLKKLALPLNSISLICLSPLMAIGDSYFYRRDNEKFAYPFFFFGGGLMAVSLIQAFSGSTATILMTFLIGTLVTGSLIFYRKQVFYSYLTQILFGISFFAAMDYVPNSSQYVPFSLMGLTLIYVFVGQLLSAFKSEIDTKPFEQFGFITMILSLIMALWHRDYAYLVYAGYAILTFAWGMLKKESFWQKVSYNMVLAAYELLIYYLNVHIVEFYTVPVGLTLLAWGIVKREETEKRNIFYILAVLLLYVPGLYNSLSESWGLHGVFLGCLALALFLLGMKLRNKIIVSSSAVILIINGIIQSYSYMRTVPRWVYMAGGGTLLIVLGMMFELKRERLQAAGKLMLEKWREWE